MLNTIYPFGNGGKYVGGFRLTREIGAGTSLKWANVTKRRAGVARLKPRINSYKLTLLVKTSRFGLRTRNTVGPDGEKNSRGSLRGNWGDLACILQIGTRVQMSKLRVGLETFQPGGKVDFPKKGRTAGYRKQGGA